MKTERGDQRKLSSDHSEYTFREYSADMDIATWASDIAIIDINQASPNYGWCHAYCTTWFANIVFLKALLDILLMHSADPLRATLTMYKKHV